MVCLARPFPGNGREALTPQQQKIRELEKRLKDAEMERDILKKAMAIFSRASK
jgi:transposase-like protein